MGDLPPYSAVAGADPGVVHGLIRQRAEPVASMTFEAAWQRDQALIAAIDGALGDLENGLAEPRSNRPRWLDGLVQRELRVASRTSWSRERFVRIRLLERLGLVTLDPDDTYVLAMVSALGRDKADKLRSDPELVERALWRVFEVEGGGEVSLTNVDRFGGDEWRHAFLELVADGTLDRTRVLEECLRALGRDFAAYRAGWFSATYLALEPSPEESAGSQSELRRLLGASVPATVAFALRQLVAIHKAGALDLPETLELLAPATLAKAKGTALEALRLARAAGPDHRIAAVRIATTALGHSHADVQRAAATLLTDLGERESLAGSGDELTPSVQVDLGLALRSRVPVASERLVQPLVPAPVRVGPQDLAERAAALLEDASDPLELEAVLDALTVPGSEERLVPLCKRARQVAERGVQFGRGDVRVTELVARTVLALLGEPTPTGEPTAPALRFLVRRAGELRLSDAPLLATPDLPGGWVSPAALVERLGRHPQPRHHDLVAALLRLHPDDREQAAHPDLPPAVRFALGGVAPPEPVARRRRAGPDAWWVAAERSRAPYSDAEAPQLHSEVSSHVWQQNGAERTSRYTRFSVRVSIARESADDEPTELLDGRTDRWGAGGISRATGDAIPALAAIWPHDAEHFLAHTALPVLESPSWAEVAHDVPPTLDALARHPGRLGTLAVHTLAAGLCATHRDHRLHAVDAFLDLVPTGRIAVTDLAVVLAQYAEAWPASRCAESLTAVTQAPGGSATAVGVLTELLPRLPVGHRGLHKLLELLRDEALRHGWPVTDPALVGWLGQLSGSSSASRTARLLLG
ncbi:hypothetical protein ACVW00_003070 [Marmoricola sp. URHA0025 HA25]